MLTAITDTVGGNRIAVYTDELGNSIDIDETITTLERRGDSLFYTSELGIDTIDLNTTDLVSSIIDTVTGSQIALYIDERGDTIAINETITRLEGDSTQIVYFKEDGTSDTIGIVDVLTVSYTHLTLPTIYSV